MADDDKVIFDDESTDFYDEFKDRMRQEPLKSVLSQNTEASKPVGGIMTVLVGVFLFALVLWYIIGKYFIGAEEPNNSAPVVISADESPVKERPHDVGGMEILGKNKTVYDRISKSRTTEPEKLVKRQEQITPPISRPAPTVKSQIVETIVTEKEIIKPAPIYQAPQAQAIAAQPSIPKALQTPLQPAKKIEIVREVKVEAREVDIKPVYTPTPSKTNSNTITPSVARVTTKAISSASGKPSLPEVINNGWKVQVLSSRDETGVSKAWNRLQKNNPDLLNNVEHEIVKADLGTKGVFYRLKVGNFSSKSQADNLCSNLKARKLNCFVTK